MSGEAGGWMWLLIDIVMVAVLAVALAYAVAAWRRRSPAADRAGERATDDLYRSGDPERGPATFRQDEK